MKTFGEQLIRAMEFRQITPTELARKIGVGEGTIANYRANRYAPRQNRIEVIANVLNVSIPFLLGYDVPMVDKNKPSTKIPVLGSIPAGIPIEAVQHVVDYEEITESMAKTGDFFALLVKGDSMSPRITDGDVVIVRKQETAENGDVVAVLINGENATLKKFYRTENGIKLIPNNHDYEPLFFTPDEVNNLPVVVLGKVVELRAKF